MATQTTNLNLVKPDYTDAADIAVINTNMDTIDSNVHGNAVDIAGIATIITGTTNNSGHSVSSGEYFIANGAKYKATATIGTGVTWADKSSSISDHDLINSLNSKIETYGKSQWVGNVTSIDTLNALTTPGRYLRYISIENVGLPGGWAVIDVSALNEYDNYVQIVTYPATGATYTRQHPTEGTWGNFESLYSKIANITVESFTSKGHIYLKKKNDVIYCSAEDITSLGTDWEEIGTTSFKNGETLMGSLVTNTGKIIKLRILATGLFQGYAINGAITSSTYVQDSCVMATPSASTNYL